MSFYHNGTLDNQMTSSRGSGDLAEFRKLSLDQQREVYFGKPLHRMAELDVEDMHTAENRTRPYEWIGKNRRIEIVLQRKITNAENFMIRDVLPIKPLPPGGKIQVTQVKFNDMSLDRIPEQGTGRLTTQTVRRWELSIERYGLAFMMEDGMAMTDMGIEQYNASILQISNAAVDQMVMDAYFNLMAAPEYSANAYKQYGIMHGNPTRDDLFEREKELWSILTKTPYGFWRMAAIGDLVFKARQVAADVIIMPTGTREYLKRNRPESIRYDSMGERAVTAYLGKGYLQQIDGVDYYESALHNVRETEVPEDPLTRIRAIGEFGDSLHNDNCNGLTKAKGYSTALRTRTIHDNRSDSMKPITLKEMFENAGLFTYDGLPSVDMGKPFFAGYRSIGDYLANKGGMLKIVNDHIIARLAVGDQDATNFTQAYDEMLQNANGVYEDSQENTKSTNAYGYNVKTGAAAGRSSSSAATTQFGLSTNGMRDYSSSSSSGRAQTWTMYTVTKDQQDAMKTSIGDSKGALTALAASAISLRGGGGGDRTADLAPVFQQVRADPNKMFNRQSVDTLLDVLNGEMSIRENRSMFHSTPHMMYLKWHLRTDERQKQLYQLSGADTKSVKDLLRLIFGDSHSKTELPVSNLMTAAAAVNTGSAFSNVPPRSDASDRDSALVPGRKFTGETLSQQDQLKFRRRMTQIEATYTRINAYAPDFLKGAYAMLVRDMDTLQSAEEEFPMLVDLADWVVNTLSALPVTAQNTQSWQVNGPITIGPTGSTKTDCAQAVVSAMLAVNGALDLMKLTEEFGQITGNGLTEIQTFAATVTADQVSGKSRIGKKLPREDKRNPLASVPITKHFFDFCIDNDVPFPVDFIFARPSMMYEVGSAIMLKKGDQTGASYYGEADFQLSNEGARKVLFGFFTVYCGARVWRHENVFVFPFIHCRRYLGGGDMSIFNNLDANQRNAYAIGDTGDRSIFIFPMHHTEKIAGQAFDITGYFPDQMASGNFQARSHLSSCAAMANIWGWRTVPRQYEPGHYEEVRPYNTVCFRMTQFMPKVEGFGATITEKGYGKSGQGHWGRCVYAGVRDDRCGRGANGGVDNNSFMFEATGTKFI